MAAPRGASTPASAGGVRPIRLDPPQLSCDQPVHGGLDRRQVTNPEIPLQLRGVCCANNAVELATSGSGDIQSEAFVLRVEFHALQGTATSFSPIPRKPPKDNAA
jgi:hypothetical protein